VSVPEKFSPAVKLRSMQGPVPGNSRRSSERVFFCICAGMIHLCGNENFAPPYFDLLSFSPQVSNPNNLKSAKQLKFLSVPTSVHLAVGIHL
jgi:hypothetical protein